MFPPTGATHFLDTLSKRQALPFGVHILDPQPYESQSKPGTQMLYPDKELRRRIVL